MLYINRKESSHTIHHLSVNDRDVTSHRDIALIMLKYTTGPSPWKSCRMLYVEPVILQQDQMNYTMLLKHLCNKFCTALYTVYTLMNV